MTASVFCHNLALYPMDTGGDDKPENSKNGGLIPLVVWRTANRKI